VTIDDAHGGSKMQTVTITLVGADEDATKAPKGRAAGGKGHGNDIDLGTNSADVLFFLEMQHDQAAAPVQPIQLNMPAGVELPEIALSGLAHMHEWAVLA
jgi:hypothetical protein